MIGFRYEIGRLDICVTLSREDYDKADSRAAESSGGSLAQMGLYDSCVHLAAAAFARLALDRKVADTEVVHEGHNIIDPHGKPELAASVAREFFDEHLRQAILSRGKLVISVVELNPATGETAGEHRMGPFVSDARLSADRCLRELTEEWQKKGVI